MATTLIRCGDHKLAPATLVCMHLADGLSRNWYAVMVDDSDIPEEWVCPQCKPHPWDLGVADWRLICMHCIRELQSAPGTKVRIDDLRTQEPEIRQDLQP